jgi:hypothetical protein
VAAGELKSGEQLQSLSGVAVVARIQPRTERASVYNVEVSRYHTYFVGDASVWAHNPCGDTFPVSKPGWRVSKFEQKEWITQRVWDMQKQLGRSAAANRAIRDHIEATIRAAGGRVADFADHLRQLGL